MAWRPHRIRSERADQRRAVLEAVGIRWHIVRIHFAHVRIFRPIDKQHNCTRKAAGCKGMHSVEVSAPLFGRDVTICKFGVRAAWGGMICA